MIDFNRFNIRFMTFLGRIRNRNRQNGSDPAGSVSSTLVTNLPYLDTLSVNHQNVDPGQTPFFKKNQKKLQFSGSGCVRIRKILPDPNPSRGILQDPR